MQGHSVCVVGAGLAGCEAAWQLARRGAHVKLFEMKPQKKTPAHSYNGFAELVCSNSLRADRLSNAVGLLKEEMRRLGSLVMRAADQTKVPAGGALAVDRKKFSDFITEAIRNEPNIEVIEGEVKSLEGFLEGPLIIASGPLTSDALAKSIKALTGEEYLHFFDAAAPIVSAGSIDMEHAFLAARYGRGGDDYINCPLSEEEYNGFYAALSEAQCVVIKDFEKNVFEGCMPIEEMAARGYKTPLFGPMKPKGLVDPKTGREPFAVVQLRKEDEMGTMLNIVGFQTHLLFPEQKRVFSMIPALKNAEFLRYGVMHRNTYINAPKLLDKHFRLKADANVRFAGQVTGVEGYVESAASGLLCGMFMAMELCGQALPEMDNKTAHGALANFVAAAATKDYQPMNINFGLIEPSDKRIRGKEQKNLYIAERALLALDGLIEQYNMDEGE